MRCCIYGAGSLGTVFGAYVTEAGGTIDLINRNKAHVEALRTNGAHITGLVDKHVAVSAMLPEDMTGIYDIIFLLTKQLHNEEVVTFLKPFLAENGVICTLQNGIPEPLIASIVGPEHTIGCTVEWGATLQAPGIAELTSDPNSMSFHMGCMEGVTKEQADRCRQVLELMCPVQMEENLLGARWSKLLINATFSGLGTVVGGTFGSVSSDALGRRVAIRAIKECIDVGHATGTEFALVQGKNITKLFYYKNAVKRSIGQLLIPIAMKKHVGITPSMLQDIRNGKPCEIDAINGVVCDYGRRFSIPTPINDKIVEAVKAIQAGTLTAKMENLHLFDALL